MFVKKYIIIAFLFSIIYSIKNVTITKKKEKVSLSDSTSKEVLFIIDVHEVNISDYIFFRIYKEKEELSYTFQYYRTSSNSELEYNLAEKVSIEPNKVSGTTLKFRILKDRFFSNIGVIITSDNYITETIHCEKTSGWDEENTIVKIVLILLFIIIFLGIVTAIICCVCRQRKRNRVNAAMQMQMYNNNMMAAQMYRQPMYGQGVNVPISYVQGYPQYYQPYNDVNGNINGNIINNVNVNNSQQVGEKNVNENTPIVEGIKNV